MVKIKANYITRGKFFVSKRILKFQSNSELITDEDIINLFLGLVRLIKKSTEIKTEEKYSMKITMLKREIENLKMHIK